MDLTIVLLVLEEAWVHISLCDNVNTQYILLCVSAPHSFLHVCANVFAQMYKQTSTHQGLYLYKREENIFKRSQIGMVKFT